MNKCTLVFIFLFCSFVLLPQTEENLHSDFLNPPLENRMNVNKHDFSTIKVLQDRYFDNTLSLNGYGGMATNVSHNNYLDSPSNFAAFVTGVSTAKSKGYDVWLYDEKLYPSGMADDKILADHPEWEAEGLLIYKKNIVANQTINTSLPGTLVMAKAVPLVAGVLQYSSATDISSSFVNGALSWTAPNGTWVVVLITHDVLYEGYQAGTIRGTEKPRYPSLLKPEVTELFITCTHKRYASAFGDKLGNYFTSTFTDEPSTMALPFSSLGYAVYPWKQNVNDEFKERYGYELNDKLLKITLDDGGEGQSLRYQYFQLISNLMSENYFKALKDYCHSQDFKSGGHLLLEESMVAHVPLYGSIMACYRQMDIPGVDCLTGSPSITRSYMFSSRLASSAAELEGNSRVMFESCPINNNNNVSGYTEPALKYIKGVHNRVMVGGVTDFNNYLQLANASSSERNEFNAYTARVVSLLSGGVRASRIAVYYPIETMWTKFKPANMSVKDWFTVTGADAEAHTLESLLLNVTYGLIDNGWEFSYIDALGLSESSVVGNSLCHGNDLKWDVLILPAAEVLPKQAFDKIVKFVNNGGKVIVLNKLPISSGTEFPSQEVTNAFEKYYTESSILFNSNFNSGQLNTQLEEMLDRDIILDSYSGVMYSHKKINGKDIYFLINDTDDNKTLVIRLPSDCQWELWNPQTGEIKPIASSFLRTFEPYESVILRTSSSGIQTISCNLDKSKLKIYPNPGSENINIDISSEIIKSVNIYNLLGKSVLNFDSSESPYLINRLINGNYIINVKTNVGNYNRIFTKF